MALKKALLDLKQRELQNEKILVVLDSKYVLDAITKRWLQSWEKNGWKTSAELVLRIRNYGWKLADYCQNFQI